MEDAPFTVKQTLVLTFIQPTLFRIGNFLIPVAGQLYQPYSAGYEYHPHSRCICFCCCHFQYIGILYSPHKFVDEPSILQQFTLEVEIHSGIYRCYAIVSAVELRSVGGCQTDGQSGKSIHFPDRGNTYSISSVVGGACNPGIIACQPLHKECPPAATKSSATTERE